tara:strand:- start:15651 stop:15800 length:150 start_codon:yes stop_codon:yes gene_type:complete
MKKLLILSVALFGLASCSNPQIKHPDFEQSPCSCLTTPWPLQETGEQNV